MDFEIEFLQKQKELADVLRAYCLSKKDLWKLIPSLALQAYGRGGFNSSHEYCFRTGLWGLRSSYLIQVNCATGTIVDFSSKNLALDNEVINLCLDDLDPAPLIEELQRKINVEDSPIGAFGEGSRGCKTPNIWRIKMALRYKVAGYRIPQEV